MISYAKSVDLDLPIRLELSGTDVTGKAAVDLTVKLANKDSADWELQTATTHYTLNELSEGDYTLTLLAARNDTTGHVRFKISGTGFDTKQYCVYVDPKLDTMVDDVWDEATAGHQTAGTTGKALTSAGSAGDPWASSVPGSYDPGTAGYQMGRIGSAGATLSAPINQLLDLTIVQGDDYNASDGRNIDFAYSGLPTIAGSTVAFRYIGEGQESATSIAMSIVSSGGASQVVRLQLTNVQTDAMPIGRGEYDIQITLASGRVITPTNRAKLIVSSDI